MWLWFLFTLKAANSSSWGIRPDQWVVEFILVARRFRGLETLGWEAWWGCGGEGGVLFVWWIRGLQRWNLCRAVSWRGQPPWHGKCRARILRHFYFSLRIYSKFVLENVHNATGVYAVHGTGTPRVTLMLVRIFIKTPSTYTIDASDVSACWAKCLGTWPVTEVEWLEEGSKFDFSWGQGYKVGGNADVDSGARERVQ